jgi:hypothetical protein
MQGRVASSDASHRPPISWCCRSIPPRLRVWRHSRISPTPIGRSLSAPSVLVASAPCRITPSRSPSPITSRSYSKKISFSAEDQEQANDGRLLRGDRIVIFDLPIGRVCVLNCHEYTHAAIIDELARKPIDFIIVTSFNPAWQLYTEYARADIHRLFCFVVLCNVGNYGGSSVLEPFSKLGGPAGALSLEGVLFSALHGTFDKATKLSGSQLFYDTAGSADKTLKFHEGGFHDLSTTLIRKR